MNDDFYSWRRHPVTVVVFAELEARIKEAQEKLVARASTSPQAELAELAGAAKALRDVLDIQVEDTNGN